jgi:hypothetical protein
LDQIQRTDWRRLLSHHDIAAMSRQKQQRQKDQKEKIRFRGIDANQRQPRGTSRAGEAKIAEHALKRVRR